MNPNYLDFEQPIAELEVKIEELQLVGSDNEINISSEIETLRDKSTKLTEKIYSNLSPWDIVKVARHPQRPYSMDYIPRFSPNSTSCTAIATLATTTPSSAVLPGSMVAR